MPPLRAPDKTKSNRCEKLPFELLVKGVKDTPQNTIGYCCCPWLSPQKLKVSTQLPKYLDYRNMKPNPAKNL